MHSGSSEGLALFPKTVLQHSRVLGLHQPICHPHPRCTCPSYCCDFQHEAVKYTDSQTMSNCRDFPAFIKEYLYIINKDLPFELSICAGKKCVMKRVPFWTIITLIMSSLPFSFLKIHIQTLSQERERTIAKMSCEKGFLFLTFSP